MIDKGTPAVDVSAQIFLMKQAVYFQFNFMVH